METKDRQNFMVVVWKAVLFWGCIFILTGFSGNARGESKYNFNGHTYEIVDDVYTWTEAKAQCEAKGGHLVTINSSEEALEIINHLPDNPKNTYWIGLQRSEVDRNTWVWITGEEVTYTSWADGEPNDEYDVEDYVLMTGKAFFVHNSAGEWNDTSNGVYDGGEYMYPGYICEWDAGKCIIDLSQKPITAHEGEKIKISGTLEGCANPSTSVFNWSIMREDGNGTHVTISPTVLEKLSEKKYSFSQEVTFQKAGEYKVKVSYADAFSETKAYVLGKVEGLNDTTDHYEKAWADRQISISWDETYCDFYGKWSITRPPDKIMPARRLARGLPCFRFSAVIREGF